jgi:hypothetical protein
MASESLGQAINKSVIDIQAAADSILQRQKYAETIKNCKEQILLAEDTEVATLKVINNLLSAHEKRIDHFEFQLASSIFNSKYFADIDDMEQINIISIFNLEDKGNFTTNKSTLITYLANGLIQALKTTLKSRFDIESHA